MTNPGKKTQSISQVQDDGGNEGKVGEMPLVFTDLPTPSLIPPAPTLHGRFQGKREAAGLQRTVS